MDLHVLRYEREGEGERERGEGLDKAVKIRLNIN